jgi:hypothetical protein
MWATKSITCQRHDRSLDANLIDWKQEVIPNFSDHFRFTGDLLNR